MNPMHRIESAMIRPGPDAQRLIGERFADRVLLTPELQRSST